LSADLTLGIDVFIGDGAGSPPASGGAPGAVPAPAPGDRAAGKYLSAGGGWDVPPGTGPRYYSASFSAQTSVTVTHNLGNAAPIVQVYDSGGLQIDAESITATGSNAVVVNFGDVTKGTIAVMG